jgi:hypothetical protein
VVDLSKERTSLPTCLMAKVEEGWLWHRRLGHVNMRNLKQLLKGEHIVGLTSVTFEKDRVCCSCVVGKQHGKRHPFKNVIYFLKFECPLLDFACYPIFFSAHR